MANLSGTSTRPAAGRSVQPSPPRLPRLPFPIRGRSPITPGQTPVGSNSHPDQNEIRRQAEAAAAVVEARERRRAAAEAARRKLNPKKKRDDLSKIPVRGRPTYRRQSFSESSGSSRTSSQTSSASRSGSGSRSTTPVDTAPKLYDPRFSEPVEDYSIIPQTASVHKVRKHRRATNYIMEPNVDITMSNANRHQIRTGAPEVFGRENYPPIVPERKQHRSKIQPDDGKHRDFRNSEYVHKSAGVPPPQQIKNVYGDFGTMDAYGGYQSRHRESKGVGSQQMRYSNIYEDPTQRYELSGRNDTRRTVQFPSQLMDRPVRPRTPHADPADMDFEFRSPHGSGLLQTRTHKPDRKRHAERDPTMMMQQPPSRKRAVILEPDVEPTINAEMRRARSRHRSRGPGAPPIDRSEPFESDAGSFAAEQRLRELRERLNMVDDAIAEIKAGSGFMDSRR